MLKYPIIVRKINNLSDARYCAGMGVEYLSFVLDNKVGTPIINDIFEGIKGWITGVQILGEYFSTENIEIEIDGVVIHQEYSVLHKDLSYPKFYVIDLSEIPEIMPPLGEFIILTNIHNQIFDPAFIQNLTSNFKVFLSFGFDKDNIDEAFQKYQLYGFCLEGGNELAPGLKSFDELAEILEMIEQ